MTSPAPFTSAPPELPGLIAASVWMASMTVASSWVEPVATARPVALMIPSVTVLESPSGAPIATATSPTCTLSEFAKVAGVSPLGAVELDDGEVGGRVGPDDGRVVERAVGGAHLDRARAGALEGDDVVVGQHVAVVGEDDARAAARAVGAGDVDGHHARGRLRRRGGGGGRRLRVLDDDVLRRCGAPGQGRRVVEERDHPGSGTAADQRARDETGDPDPQPAGPPRCRGGRRPRALRPGSRRSRGSWAGPGPCGAAHGYCCPANRSAWGAYAGSCPAGP